ncbi:hypothetical protein V8C86DRAFT_2465963, partial [Haematococcus lacustris]
EGIPKRLRQVVDEVGYLTLPAVVCVILSRAARASPETFLFCCASVRSGCSASSRSSMSLSGSSGTGLGAVRPFFLAIENNIVKPSQILGQLSVLFVCINKITMLPGSPE